MHVNGFLTWVKLGNFVFELADSANGALKSLLYEYSLLGVHTLIVALFQFAVNINVFDIKNGQILEDFIFRPVHENGLSSLIQLSRIMLSLHLFLQLMHRFLQLQIICPVKLMKYGKKNETTHKI